MLVRRNDLPRINKLTGIGSAGFTHGYREMTEAWRWRTMYYSDETGPPPPRNSTLRVSRHPNAHFHLGSAIETMCADARPHHGAHQPRQDTSPPTSSSSPPASPWRPRRARRSPPSPTHRHLGRSLHAAAGTGERRTRRLPVPRAAFPVHREAAGDAPFLADIHCFNHAASLSIGKVAGDIPGISTGAAWLADGIAAEFYNRDIEAHWQILLDFDKPELFGDEWTDAER